jgi:hypothetical protein
MNEEPNPQSRLSSSGYSVQRLPRGWNFKELLHNKLRFILTINVPLILKVRDVMVF